MSNIKRNYIAERNDRIRSLFKRIKETGRTTKFAMKFIKNELKGELSVHSIRKIIYSN